MEKQFSHMFLGFIVVIFNFLKVRGGGGGVGLTNHRIFLPLFQSIRLVGFK